MPTSALLILCSCPDRTNAERLAGELIDNRLAACVSVSAPVTSFYEWQGERQSEQEVMLFIKSTRQRYPELERHLSSSHPYELPEIIAVPVEQGLSGYLNWLEECTKEA